MQSMVCCCSCYGIERSFVCFVSCIQFTGRAGISGCLYPFCGPVLCPGHRRIDIFVFFLCILCIRKFHFRITGGSNCDFKSITLSKWCCICFQRSVFVDHFHSSTSACRIRFSIDRYRGNVFDIICKFFVACICIFCYSRILIIVIVRCRCAVSRQDKGCCHLRIIVVFVRHCQRIFPFFCIFKYDFSVFHTEIQSINLVFRRKICRKIRHCNFCLPCRYFRICYLYRLTCFFRYIQVIYRDLINSLRSIICHLIDMLTHHIYIMCRRCGTIMYC